MSKQVEGVITWIKSFLDDIYADITHNHDDRYYTENEVDSALSGKQSTLVSGTNIKTINYESLLGNGNINISGGSGGISGVATSLELVSKNDNPNGVLCFNNVEDNYIEKSSTNGLMKNDGSVDTTQYLSSLPSHNHDDRYYTESEVDTALNGKADSVHNHDDRYYTESEVDTALNGKQATLVSGTNIKTINNESLLGTGNINISGSGEQNVFYGTCDTTGTTQIKVVTVDNWSFDTGNILFVKFSDYNKYNGTAKISIDGVTKDIATVGTTKTSRYYWEAGEMVGFVYDGTNMLMLEQGTATTTYYGITKLSSSTSSTSETLSATPKAVKTAYDLADGKQDALVSGTNIKTINNESILGSGNISVGGGSNVTKTSDLTNDGEDGVNPFVSDDDSRLTNARTPTTHTHTKSQITDFPTLSTVATSGSYNDLTNKPSMQPIQILVTYTDNTTETIAFMKYTGN